MIGSGFGPGGNFIAEYLFDLNRIIISKYRKRRKQMTNIISMRMQKEEVLLQQLLEGKIANWCHL